IKCATPGRNRPMTTKHSARLTLHMTLTKQGTLADRFGMRPDDPWYRVYSADQEPDKLTLYPDRNSVNDAGTRGIHKSRTGLVNHIRQEQVEGEARTKGKALVLKNKRGLFWDGADWVDDWQSAFLVEHLGPSTFEPCRFFLFRPLVTWQGEEIK